MIAAMNSPSAVPTTGTITNNQTIPCTKSSSIGNRPSSRQTNKTAPMIHNVDFFTTSLISPPSP